LDGEQKELLRELLEADKPVQDIYKQLLKSLKEKNKDNSRLMKKI